MRPFDLEDAKVMTVVAGDPVHALSGSIECPKDMCIICSFWGWIQQLRESMG
jgi:hypothetical protein